MVTLAYLGGLLDDDRNAIGVFSPDLFALGPPFLESVLFFVLPLHFDGIFKLTKYSIGFCCAVDSRIFLEFALVNRLPDFSMWRRTENGHNLVEKAKIKLHSGLLFCHYGAHCKGSLAWNWAILPWNLTHFAWNLTYFTWNLIYFSLKFDAFRYICQVLQKIDKVFWKFNHF